MLRWLKQFRRHCPADKRITQWGLLQCALGVAWLVIPFEDRGELPASLRHLDSSGRVLALGAEHHTDRLPPDQRVRETESPPWQSWPCAITKSQTRSSSIYFAPNARVQGNTARSWAGRSHASRRMGNLPVYQLAEISVSWPGRFTVNSWFRGTTASKSGELLWRPPKCPDVQAQSVASECSERVGQLR